MSLIPDFENSLRAFHRELFDPNYFFGYSPYNQPIPRDFFSSAFYKPWDTGFRPWEKLMEPVEQMSNAMSRFALNEIGNISTDKEKFQVNVDVQHFAPEEIKVKVIDGHVIVQGKHEEKQDEHGYISREFVRRYALPKGCLPDTVESKLSTDGVLSVSAPMVLALPSTGERIVPITHTGPVQKQPGAPDVVSEETK